MGAFGIVLPTLAVILGPPSLVPAGAESGDGVGRLLRLRERVGVRTQPAVTHAPRRRRSADRCYPSDIETAIAGAADRYRIDPDLIRAVISVESAGNPRAVSRKGARGLMQVMPATGRELGVNDPAHLFDIRANVTAGTRYLRYTYDRFGNWPDALGAYNAGPTRIASGRVPAETRRYVRRVLARHSEYRQVGCS